MAEIREIDSKLYNAIYGIPRVGDAEIIWDIIRNNDAILREAIEVEKDESSQRVLVKGLVICKEILLDYKRVNTDIYERLVNLIYSNTDIARIVVGKLSNCGDSYLLITLRNHNLKLTKEQKEFAVSEAMNKIGTVQNKHKQDKNLTEFDKNETTHIGSIHEVTIDKNHTAQYVANTINSLNSTQVHGIYPQDIRYEILRNPNWTMEEKGKLIYDFWYSDQEYEDTLEEWEWGIINDDANYNGEPMPELFISELYSYTYGFLCAFYGDVETTDRIWDEIIFCKYMKMLRPKTSNKIIPFRKKLNK